MKSTNGKFWALGHEFEVKGKRLGQTVMTCFLPRLYAEIIAYDEKCDLWLTEHIFENGSRGGNGLLTERFLQAVERADKRDGTETITVPSNDETPC